MPPTIRASRTSSTAASTVAHSCVVFVTVLSKSVVHDNPLVLPHIIDWHMQVKDETETGAEADHDGGDDLGEEAA